MTREPYPLTLSLLTLATTSLGLAAAALGVQWGAAPAGDALPLAWLYVHVMLTFTWLIVWPALALLPMARPRVAEAAWWEALAIGSGAIPAVLVAGFVTGVSPPAAGIMLILQLGAAVLMAGCLQCHRRFSAISAAGIGLLAALTLTGPIAAFLLAQFFPTTAAANWILFPLLATGHTAAALTSPAEARLICVLAATELLVGLLLLGLARGQEKAPGTPVPRA